MIIDTASLAAALARQIQILREHAEACPACRFLDSGEHACPPMSWECPHECVIRDVLSGCVAMIKNAMEYR